MFSLVRNITLPRHSVVKVLPDNDPILPDDLVRNTYYIGFTSDTVSPSCINKMNWQLAKDAIPYWVGKTLSEFEVGSPAGLDRVEVIRILFKGDPDDV